jgi:iron complex outermembrane receptor protein
MRKSTVSIAVATALAGGGMFGPGVHAAESGAQSGSGELGEIVVTGLKREERLVEVPVSVQVFDATTIEQAGIDQPSDFLKLTSNVNFYSSITAGDFLVNVRGQASVRGAEPSVRIIVDGVPIGSPSEFNTVLTDLQQIEILKGPQGAIYGRNASAGAIIITTRAPQNEFGGQALASVGNYNTYNGSLSVGGALVPDKLLARATFATTNTDGAFENVNTGDLVRRWRENVGRVRFDWLLSDALKVDLRVGASNGRGGAVAYQPKLGIVPGLSPNGTIVGGVPITEVGSNTVIDIPFVADVPSAYERDVWNTSLKVDWTGESIAFTSISGYSQTSEHWGGKGFPYGAPNDPSTNFFVWTGIFGDNTQNYRTTNRQFSQELRLTSRGQGPLQWQVGAEYINAKFMKLTNNALNGAVPPGLTGAALIGYTGFDQTGRRTLLGGGASVPWPLRLRGLNSMYPSTSFYTSEFPAENIAPFANVKWNVSDALTVTLAARYDREKREVKAIGPDVFNPFVGGSYNPCVRITRQTAAQCNEGTDETFTQLQPKVTVDYKFSDNISAYVGWGRSFKSGGFNPIGTREQLVQARIPIFLQLGQTPAQARASAEASVFTQDVFKKEVAETAEVGFKAQFPEVGVQLNAAVFMTDVDNAQQYRFDPGASIEAIDSIDKVDLKGFEFDAQWRVTDNVTLFATYGFTDNEVKEFRADPTLEGNHVPYASESNGALGVQAQFPVSDRFALNTRLEVVHTGETWWDVQNTPTTQRDSFTLLNARVGLAAGDQWELTAAAQNLTDEDYIQEAVPLLPFLNVLAPANPRTYSLEMKVRF